MTDDELIERAQLAALDEDNRILGRPVPALTTLLYQVCNNRRSQFDEVCRLITSIQRKTIELVRRDT